MRRHVSTYVVVSDPYDGWAKIGRTEGLDIGGRVPGLQTGNPRRLRAIAGWHVDAEEVFHLHFAPLRGVGEWFALPPVLLTDMISRTHHGDLKEWRRHDHLALLHDWPVQRVLALADGESDPESLARQFAAPTTITTTPKLRKVVDAG